MNSAIITIGDELIQGFTLDTNASWISKYLNSYNITVKKVITIGDDEEDIVSSLEYLKKDKTIKYVFITGGLGPTHDDITKIVLSKYFKSDLVLNQNHLALLVDRFKSKNMVVPENLNSQAMTLKRSKPIPNKAGTALGMVIEDKLKTYFVIPGVPLEMKDMFKNHISNNYLADYQKDAQSYVDIYTTGVYESKLYSLLLPIIDKNSINFKVSFLPKYTGVNLRLSKINSKISNSEFVEFKEEITSIIRKYVYSDCGETLESVVSNMLIDANLKISVAESCTGGLISKKLTDIPGSSSYFLGSVVAYSNELKVKSLNVKKNDIDKYGAVSKEVAIQMAQGIKESTHSDISISTTGISGPGGGTKDKPVGLIYIAICGKDNSEVKKFNLYPNRSIHRQISSSVAMNMLRLFLLKKTYN